MSADKTSSATKPDVPPAAGGQGADAGTHAAAKAQRDAPARQPATARTRQDHADAILAGTPGHPREAPTASPTPDHQHAAKPGRTAPEHGRPGPDAGTAGAERQHDAPAQQPAKTRTRQDHADAILAGTPGHPREAPTASPTPDHQHAGKPGRTAPDDGRPGGQNAGTADGAVRQDAPGPTGTGHGAPEGTPGSTYPGRGADASQPQRVGREANEHQPAEQPAGRLAPDTATAGNGTHTHDGRHGGQPDRDRIPPAELGAGPAPDNRGPGAASTADSQPGAPGTSRDPARPGPTPETRATADHSGDTAPGPAGSADGGDNRHDVSQREEPGKSKKVYVDGHEIEVTGNPHDGIWIQGLPSEVPDKTGDVLASPESTKLSRGDKFFRKAVEGAEDLYDGLEKNTSLSYDALQHPPPTHAEVGVSSGLPHLEAQQHYAPDTGGIATGILTVGLLGWSAGHRIHDWIDTRARRAHDASNR